MTLNKAVCEPHSYQKHLFPSLWDVSWVTDFTQADVDATGDGGRSDE